MKELFDIYTTIESILGSIDKHLSGLSQVRYDSWFDSECKEFTGKLLANVVGGTGVKKARIMGSR
ncbi:hypothetical protein CJNNKLLH_3098 [Methylorubrum thiocyanatum]|nr:hypothetical protein CJNNKLLH_3098 [Methylorubrum thiocyanatum]